VTAMDDVAVVVPAFNAADYLGEALDSIAAQTRPPVEVVVIDDGSTDGTPTIAEDRGVRCITQENAGPAAARNRGIKETVAPLIAFLDADDRFVPEKLDRQVAELHSTDAVACFTDAWNLVDGVRRDRKVRADMAGGAVHLADLLPGNPVICSSVVVRRDALAEVGDFDADPVLVSTEDYDLWLRLLELGEMRYIADPLADYRVHCASLSDNRRFLSGIDRIMEKLAERQAGLAGLAELVARRRAGVRIDAAYDAVRAGRRRQARELLSEARRLGGWNWPLARVWMRTWRLFS